MKTHYDALAETYGFENETLSLMSFLTARAMMSLYKKDYKSLHNIIDVLYISTYEKIKNDLPKDFEKELEAVNNKIYSLNDKTASDKSRLFEDTRKLWGMMAEALTKSNLMFRAKVDPSEMVAH